MNSTKTSAYIFMGIGAAIFAIALLFVLGNSALSVPAAVLGLGVGAIIAAPLIGTGLYLRNKSQGEASEDAQIEKQRKLLNLLMTEKQADFRKIALDINVTRDQAREMVKDLISRGVFEGSVDWDTGVVYSKEAARDFGHLAAAETPSAASTAGAEAAARGKTSAN